MGGTLLAMMWSIEPIRLLKGLRKGYWRWNRNHRIRQEFGRNKKREKKKEQWKWKITEADAAKITEKDYKTFKKVLRVRLKERFTLFEEKSYSDLDRTLIFLRVNGENGISDDDAAKIPKEAFKKLPKRTRANALAKFGGAFEYVTRLKRTLFLLEVLGEGAFSRISEDDAVKIKKEEFEQLDKALRRLLLESYRRVCGFSNLERTLTLLRLDGESSMEKMVEGNAAEIPKEEFEKLDKKLRAKLLKEFRGAFEFVDSLERTLFVLKVDGESAVKEMINGMF
ncbi:hypothetical protein TrLO_g11857 [Triparma laevis f. longispina]|uniref:Uncharacterized protein n=1 Tax=Triparma laevis f. longispina TaxID=1714387 RepID=A0A9W7KZ12_9STRA|nr:hypothetical protein TrLO_g11857 [Triparma laevis f. longispina]